MDKIPICFFCKNHYLNFCHLRQLNTEQLIEAVEEDAFDVKQCLRIDNLIVKVKEVSKDGRV